MSIDDFIDDDSTPLEEESEGSVRHTPEYVKAIYSELGMEGSLDLMHQDYMPKNPEAGGMTPLYAKRRAYFWVYREILDYAVNPRHENDYNDHQWGINTYEILSHFGSWGELRKTKDDFTVYLINCIIETMYQRGMGLPEEYASFTFGFEQSDTIKKEDVKGLIFYEFGEAYDLEVPVTLKREDEFFVLFFLLKLSLIAPLQVDAFLEYQLQVSFDNDRDTFERFIIILLRHQRILKFTNAKGNSLERKLVKKKYLATVKEWLNDMKLTQEDNRSVSTNDKPEFVKQPEPELVPIQWLGTQKELGELLIELKNKGWIGEEIIYKTIKALFTNSNTIEQVLKPSFDPKTKKPQYEEIYKPRYLAKFDNVRPNPKKK